MLGNLKDMKETWEFWQVNRTKAEQELSRSGIQLLLEGESVPVSRLADVLGWDEKQVTDELGQLAAEGRCTLDTVGALTGIMGLSVVKAPHQLRMNEKTFYTWCALDAVSIPAALGVDALVKSHTADSGREFGLHFQDGRWEPENVWINLIKPEQGTNLCGGT